MTIAGFTQKRECAYCHSNVHLERRRRPFLVRLLSGLLPLRYYWCHYCRRGITVVGQDDRVGVNLTTR